MKCNMGKTDRIARAIVGAVYFESWWGAVGVIPLFTAAIGWYPAYVPSGISSAGK